MKKKRVRIYYTRRREIHAGKECCSHCCKPLSAYGGSANGEGVYCRSCIRRHTNSRGLHAKWIELTTCPYCVTAGAIAI